MLGRRDEIATTFAEIASSRRIKQLAIESLGLKSAQLYSVGSKLVAGTNIIEFTVQGPDPDVTRDVANAIGATTEEYVQGSYEVFNLRLLDEATSPRRPKSPDISLNLTLATILSLVLGIGLAFLSSYLETPLHSVANFNIIDAQTGAYNKDYFLKRLSSEMVRAKRNRYPLSVALLRLDNLGLMKGLNSTKTRGEVLHQVSNFASQYLREEDILAHLEDDTFGILLPDLAGENAKAMMEYLQTRVSLVPFQSTNDGVKFNLKGIVGIATYNYNGTSREEFVAMADRALQLAKVSHNGNAYLINADSVEN
jgi:diguanylate cyclase (GGDEF)-like protein